MAPRQKPLSVAGFLVGDWLPAIEQTVRPSTFVGYRGHVENHIVPLLGSKPLNELDGPTLNILLSTLLASGNRKRPGALSSATVRRVYATLHRALGDAVRWGVLNHNPADSCDPPRCAAALDRITTWEVHEVRRFLEMTRGDQLHALWFLLATTGLRRGEALGLVWRDIDLDGATISVVQTLITVGHSVQTSSPKSARGRRVVALDAPTVDVLRSHRQATANSALDDFVFVDRSGASLHPTSVTRAFRQSVRKAGLRMIRLHDLRHTHATLALKAGVHPKIVSERLGHSTVSLTLDVYSHALPSLQRGAADLMASIVFPREQPVTGPESLGPRADPS